MRYQIFRPLLGSSSYERPIAARGSEVFGGITRGTETFGNVDVERRDLFVGLSFKGMPGGGSHSIDLTVQPTIFTYGRSSRTGVPVAELENAQAEPFATVLYRVVDRENVRNAEDLSSLVFLNLVGVGSYGTARSGPSDFDRLRVGIQADDKLVGRQRGGVTRLASGRYEWQSFINLGRREHVAVASLSMDF